MHFRDYMKVNRLEVEEIAELLGIAPQTVYNMRHGKSKLSLSKSRLIRLYTDIKDEQAREKIRTDFNPLGLTMVELDLLLKSAEEQIIIA